MDEKRSVRVLLEVDLWEISIVTFPMNEAARIAGVKQAVSPQEAGQDLHQLALSIARARHIMQP